MHDPLSLAPRRTIFECVRANPGAHLRDVARRCALPLGTALYHLDTLEAAGLVAPRRDGRYKRYFEGGSIGRREKEVLSALRHETPRRIVELLLVTPPQTQRDLCGAIGVSRSTLSFHVTSLTMQGILVRLESRPERRYEVAERALATALLERYHVSLTPTAPAPQAAPAEAVA